MSGHDGARSLEDRVERANDGSDIVVQTIVGNLVEQAPTCRNCNHITHVSDNRKRILKHLGFSFLRIDIEVHYKIYRCPKCARIHRNGIPFKAKGHEKRTLVEYVDRVIEIAKAHGFPVFDMYRNLGIDLSKPDQAKQYSYDGYHFNEVANHIIAEKLAGFLQTLPDSK